MLMAAIAAAAIIYYLVIQPAREKEVEMEKDENENLKAEAEAKTQLVAAKERQQKIDDQEFLAKADDLEAKLIALAYRTARKWERNKRDDKCWFKNSDSCTRKLRKIQRKNHDDSHFLQQAVGKFNKNRKDEIPAGFQVTFSNGKARIDSPNATTSHTFWWEYKVDYR